MCSPRTVSHITADHPMLYGELLALPQSSGLTLRRRAFATKSIRASDQDLLDIKKLKETLTDDKI
jgi:hypothetical protein